MHKNSTQGKHGETKKMLVSMKKEKLQPEMVNTIIIHATIFNLQELLKMKQVKSHTFLINLMNVTRKYNYMQELMVMKIFRNSIDVSKAVMFMSGL